MGASTGQNEPGLDGGYGSRAVSASLPYPTLIGATRSRSTDPGVPWFRMSGWAGGAPLCAFSRRSGHGTTRRATCRPPSHRRL